MRTFIAFEIANDIKEAAETLINKLAPVQSAVKWVERKNMHLTLKFLGEVAEKKVPEIKARLKKSLETVEAFTVSFQGLMAFPSLKCPRVFCIKTNQGREKLERLKEIIECAMEDLGFARENREYKPHLTIGRVKSHKGVNKLKEIFGDYEKTNFGQMKVDRVLLMKSTLTRTGPIYEVLEGYSLPAGKGE